jgi:hypothetical protein
MYTSLHHIPNLILLLLRVYTKVSNDNYTTSIFVPTKYITSKTCEYIVLFKIYGPVE